MTPTAHEAEAAKVQSLLNEAEGRPFDHVTDFTAFGDVRAVHRDTERLCVWCAAHDVTGASLELQLWWRDHQLADASKALVAEKAAEWARIYASACAKLTPLELAVVQGVR